MVGRSKVTASPEARRSLEVLSCSCDRGEADRARAVLLTLDGWTAGRIAQAFGVREDTVRQWRSDFMAGGAEGLKARRAAGPAPAKSEAALRVAAPLLAAPAADRPNWTLSRLAAEIERCEGLSISRSQLSRALKKGALSTNGRGTR